MAVPWHKTSSVRASATWRFLPAGPWEQYDGAIRAGRGGVCACELTRGAQRDTERERGREEERRRGGEKERRRERNSVQSSRGSPGLGEGVEKGEKE